MNVDCNQSATNKKPRLTFVEINFYKVFKTNFFRKTGSNFFQQSLCETEDCEHLVNIANP